MEEPNKNNIDEIDKMLYEYFADNKEVPVSTKNAIKTALHKNETKDIINFKVVATFFTIFLLTTGVVFAKDIGDFFNKIFNLNSINLNNDSIVNAIESEEYVQNVSMDYIDIDNNYKIKVDYLMLDDINLYIIFNLYFKNNIESNYRFSLLDLKITDNNGNSLYDANTLNSIQNNGLITTSGWKNIDADNDEIKELFFLISNGLPNIDSLNIKFNKVKLYNPNNLTSGCVDINGDCNFNIDLIDKFKNRNIIEYAMPDNKDSEYELCKCISTNTGLYLLYKTANFDTNFKFLNITTTYDRSHLGMDYNKIYYFVTQYHISKDKLQEFENVKFLDNNNKKIVLKRIN